MTNLVTLVFTDIVGSTALKQQLGDRAGATLLEQHDQLVRALLAEFPRAQEIGTAGDSFFCAFTTPSEAVKFALLMQARIRAFNQGRATAITDRIGIHLGEVVVKDPAVKLQSKDLYGLSLDTCARVMGLAEGGRILMTRPVYDSARSVLRWEEIEGVKEVAWREHGKYVLKGLEEPLEICEVGEAQSQTFASPTSTDKAVRMGEGGSSVFSSWPPPQGTVLLNRYKVGELVGSGGMGAVHRGTDLNLGRTVALKFIPAELANSPERIDRFKREAKALAALNHPSVVTVFSVEETGGRHFISMELLEGQPLTRSIPEKGMALGEFLNVAVPLVEALEVAHEQGIIHRDLKPSNIMIVGGRRVKVIDFGLAKLQPSESAQASGTSPPSVSTGDASLLGTPAYMSPEQAQGLPLDARSDLFSLGTIFYELLTGKRPFHGDSSAAVISAVLRDVPPSVDVSRKDLPETVTELVAQCLEKDPKKRPASAVKVLEILNQLRAGLTASHSGIGPLPALEQRRSKSAMIVAVAAVVVAVVAVLWNREVKKGREAGIESPASSNTASAGTSTPRFLVPHPLLTGPESEEYSAFSPDGQKLAFVKPVNGFRQVFVRNLAGDGETVQVTSDSRDHLQPDFSPDGKEIVFAAGVDWEPQVKASDVWGGVIYPTTCNIWSHNFASKKSRLIVETGANPRFNKSGTLAYGAASGKAMRIWTCDGNGNQARPVTDDPEAVDHFEPSWSPDGSKIVFRRQAGKYQAKLAVFDLKTRKIADLTKEEFLSDPVWAPSGKHIYFTANLNSGFNLWRISVNAAGQRAGPYEPVTFGIGRDLYARFSPDGKRLVYTILTWNSDIWAMPMDPGTGKQTSDPFPLVVSPREDTRGDWSGDSKKVVFTSDRNGDMNLYVADFDAATRTLGTPVQITFDKGGDYQATWNPKGGQIAYFSRKSGNEDIWIVDVDASGHAQGKPRQLTTDPASDVNPVFSPDGKHIAFMSARTGVIQPWVMDPDGRNQRPVSKDSIGGHYMRWFDAESIGYPGKGLHRGYLDGREPEKLTGPAWAHLTLSSGNRFVGDNDHTSIYTRSFQSTNFTEIFRFPDKNVGVDYTVWSPDGKFMLFDRSNPQGGDIYYLDGVE